MVPTIVFFHRVLIYSLALLFLSSIHILKEQSSEEFSPLYSYHLGFDLTNIYYKPSLCCLYLIFTGSPIHLPLGALKEKVPHFSEKTCSPHQFEPRTENILVDPEAIDN
jgi:hypothetical protein